MSPSLALCMIARNEETCLARCLESVEGAVDGLYVTDTGSTDGTIEIARRFGATMRYFNWCDDFAAARNASIEGVAEDWILFLDADDFFPPGEARKLRTLLSDTRHVAYELTYELMAGHTPAPARRLFRNGLGLRFEGIIHENLRRSLAGIPGASTGRVPVTLRHLGYTAGSLPFKLRRNLPLLQREWERCAGAAGDRAQRIYVGKELGHALILLGRGREGEELLLTLLEEMAVLGAEGADREWKVVVPATLLWHYQEQGRGAAALQLCTRLESSFGCHPVFRLYRGIARFGVGELAGALTDLESFEQYCGQNRLEISVPEGYTNAVLWDLLGQCCLRVGAVGRAVEYFERCLAHEPDSREYQVKAHLARSRM